MSSRKHKARQACLMVLFTWTSDLRPVEAEDEISVEGGTKAETPGAGTGGQGNIPGCSIV